MLDKNRVQDDVNRALAEDVGELDVTATLIPENTQVTATVISREPMVVCGIPWVNCLFNTVNPDIKITWLVDEGAKLAHAETLCKLTGNARSILTAERSALNFLQTLSATATQTHEYCSRLAGYHTQLLDTRKTIPGLRFAQKYAVVCGGGVNHRMGLYDAFLIKENHIKGCGSIAAAVAEARKQNKKALIEVEVENILELKEALAAKPDRIMLDNFSLDTLKQAIRIKGSAPCEFEASGGVDLTTIVAIAQTGIDFVSVGAITKSIRAIDLSLLVEGSVS